MVPGGVGAQHGEMPTTLVAQARRLSAGTPPDRDRVVDLLRASSLVVVVLGHVLMALVTWPDGRPVLDNLLGHVPGLPLVTWALQVMPLFFLAGACANARSWESAERRGVPWRRWAQDRLARLVRPLVVYLGVWIVLVLVAQAVLGPATTRPLAALATQLLWFLGVYIPVTVATPWMVRRATRAPWATPALLLAGVAAVDLARFATGNVAFGLLNFLLVWLMAAQLGLAVTRHRPSGAVLAGLALGGLAVNAVLVTVGPYPVSMVGLPGGTMSNMAPPTLVLAVHCWVLTALAGLLWDRLDRLARRTRVWTATVAVGACSMTVYLWHLTALVVVVVAEHAVGFDRGTRVGTGWFWVATAVHVSLVLAVVALIVTVAAPAEHRRIPGLDLPASGTGSAVGPAPSAAGAVLVGAGSGACAVGLLVLSATGMGGFPFGHVTRYAGLPLTPGFGLLLLVVGAALSRRGATGPVGRFGRIPEMDDRRDDDAADQLRDLQAMIATRMRAAGETPDSMVAALLADRVADTSLD